MKYKMYSKQIVTDVLDLAHYPEFVNRTSVIVSVIVSLIFDFFFTLFAFNFYIASLGITWGLIIGNYGFVPGMILVIIYFLHGTTKAIVLCCCIPLYFYERNENNNNNEPSEHLIQI